MAVGDVNSDAKGSGARFNTGKPDFSLIPLCTLEDEARVWEYGKAKYSARGDCVCSAGNAARQLLEDGKTNAQNAEAHTKNNYGSPTQNLQSANEKTDVTGIETTQSELKQSKKREKKNKNLTLNTNVKASMQGLDENTDLVQKNTTILSRTGAQYANPQTDYTLTTAIEPEKLEACYAIPATLALDLSKGLTNGLQKHSPTCGVHKITGATGAFNWMKGMDWSIPFACLQRHLAAWQRGEELDPESGLPHLAHAACNLRMLTLFSKTYQEGDDRPVKWLEGVKNVTD